MNKLSPFRRQTARAGARYGETMADKLYLAEVALSLAPALTILLIFVIVDFFFGETAIGSQNFLALIFASIAVAVTMFYGWYYGYVVSKVATFVIVGRYLLRPRRI
jgi:drug/metabolite transporter (DMT)-like permease